MKVIEPSYEVTYPNIKDPEAVKKIYQQIEAAGRTCYKSEDKITDLSAARFVGAMVRNHHEAMLEHASMTVRFIVDRGVTHEAVRHRLSSFAQESTRYCNYSQDKFGSEITVIEPVFYKDIPAGDKKLAQKILSETTHFDPEDKRMSDELLRRYAAWWNDCSRAEQSYFLLLRLGATPEEARAVLPISLKSEIVWTANMREWRHIFKLRAAGQTGRPHPQIVQVMVPLLEECQEKMPELFGDISIPEEYAFI